MCGVINYSYDAYMELNSIPHSDIMNSYSHQYKCMQVIFELPVSLLIEPTKKRLLRKVDQHFVEKLKSAMLENPSSDSAPIVALVCLKDGEDFDPVHLRVIPTIMRPSVGTTHDRPYKN